MFTQGLIFFAVIVACAVIVVMPIVLLVTGVGVSIMTSVLSPLIVVLVLALIVISSYIGAYKFLVTEWSREDPDQPSDLSSDGFGV